MKIVFIVHDAIRGGAQLLALQYVNYFIKQFSANVLVVLQEGGELENDFASITTTVYWPNYQKIPFTGIFGKVYKKISKRNRKISKLYKTIINFKPTIVYINSVAALKGTSTLKGLLQCPFVCHVHELSMSIRYYCGEERFTQSKSYISHYIAASEAVKTNLVEIYGINPKRITKIYECVSLNHVEKFKINNSFNAREELGIPADAFVVGSSGTFEWRKAPDLFIQIAKFVQTQDIARPIYFLWIGGNQTSEGYHQLKYDVDHSGLTNRIIFIGATSEPWKYFTAFDIFLLPSREDPFPVVCLEAAAFKKPILCFDKVGGMPEFVEDDAGFVIPYLDIAKMGETIMLLTHNQKLCYDLGQRALEKVVESLNTDNVVNQIWKTIIDISKDELVT